MELKEYMKKVNNLFLPLDKKVKNETATEKELIEYSILKNIFEWTEWITMDETEEQKENRKIISIAAEKIRKMQ